MASPLHKCVKVARMQPHTHVINDEISLLIREATVGDARGILSYLNDVGGESDFLTFGAGEFNLSEREERDILRNYQDADNQIYLLGLIDERIASILTFSAGQRPRTRHSGEFGMSVRQNYWGLGIGTLMVDALTAWAKQTDIIKKINLRVRTDNPRAIALYEREGFMIEGTMRKEIFLDGEYFDYHWMGLEV